MTSDAIYAALGRILAIVDKAVGLTLPDFRGCLASPKTQLLGLLLGRAREALRQRPHLLVELVEIMNSLPKEDLMALPHETPLPMRGYMLLSFARHRTALSDTTAALPGAKEETVAIFRNAENPTIYDHPLSKDLEALVGRVARRLAEEFDALSLTDELEVQRVSTEEGPGFVPMTDGGFFADFIVYSGDLEDDPQLLARLPAAAAGQVRDMAADARARALELFKESHAGLLAERGVDIGGCADADDAAFLLRKAGLESERGDLEVLLRDQAVSDDTGVRVRVGALYHHAQPKQLYFFLTVNTFAPYFWAQNEIRRDAGGRDVPIFDHMVYERSLDLGRADGETLVQVERQMLDSLAEPKQAQPADAGGPGM